MLEDALVNGLLHNLEDAVLYDAVGRDKARARRYDFRDEGVGPKGIRDEVAGSIHQGTADDREGGE
jgi:hypothetical protein